MNALLARQLRKYLPDLDLNDPRWAAFVDVVDAAYVEHDQDRAFLERTLEVTSAELTEANEKLRREAEKQLASLNRYYQQALEYQQGMILCVRRTPRGFEHILCRGELITRLGLTPADIEGRTIDEVAPPAHAATLNAAFERAWNGEPHSFAYTTIDGFELFCMLRPRIENGGVQEIIASIVEITALKQAERELRAAKERAEAADRAKSEFLAVMSHEIRTPLNAVLGFASLLQYSPLNPEQRTWLKTIGESGESLLALINDILDFSKIEAGQLTLHVESLELAALLDQLGSMFRSRVEAKGVTLDLVTAPGVPEAIVSDPQRLRQILVNLIGNAVKFTPQGSIRVLVYSGPPAPDFAPDERQLYFAVADTGIGIPPDRRDRLFKPFSQVDSSTTRHYGGSGLGLAICDRLVRMLGGEITCESKPDQGSTFTFWVKVKVPDAAAHPAAQPPPAAIPAAPPAPPRSLRILVAEDQPQNRQLIKRVLLTRGYQSDVVEDGRAAVDAFARQPYDLVLLDLRMPEMDGYEAADVIRRQTRAGRRPYIYALTANVFPEERQRCLASGMDGILSKPLDFKELFGTLEDIEAALASGPV